MLAGFVAAEGTFTCSPPRRFRFAIALGRTDASMCTAARDLLGVGGITTSPRRRAHYDDEVTYQVQSHRDLVQVVVPFMDEHLPPCHKRDQYLVWKAHLLDAWHHPPSRSARRVDDG